MWDAEFFRALLASPTFGTVLLYAALSLGLAVVPFWVLRARLRPLAGAIHRDRSGAAAAVDFALTAPIMMVVVMLVLQFAILANGALVVHYAAFVAARAALVHSWIYPDENLAAQALGRPFPNPQVRSHAEQAARTALIAASPASPRIPKSPDEPPASVMNAIGAAFPDFRGDDFEGRRRGALVEKARFAFDPGNGAIEIGYPISTDINLGAELPIPLEQGSPVTATVSFPLYLGLPIAVRLWCVTGALCECRGRFCFRPATAKVTLR